MPVLLRQEIAAARQAGQGPWPSVTQAHREAAHLFKPIFEAVQHLAQALAGHEHITMIMRANDVNLALGQERRIRTSRAGWQHDFTVEDAIDCPDLGAAVERTRSRRPMR